MGQRVFQVSSCDNVVSTLFIKPSNFLQTLVEEVSAHSGQFQKVLADGGQIDKDKVGKLKESDLESQVDEKKLFVTAGLELQQVIVTIFINTPSVFKIICSGLHLLIFSLTVWLIH